MTGILILLYPVQNTSCEHSRVELVFAECYVLLRTRQAVPQQCDIRHCRSSRAEELIAAYIPYPSIDTRSSTAYFANQAAASLALAAKMAGSFPRNLYSSCILVPTSRTGGRTQGTRHPRPFPLPPFPTTHRPRGVISTGWSPHRSTASHKSTHNDDHDEDDFYDSSM